MSIDPADLAAILRRVELAGGKVLQIVLPVPPDSEGWFPIAEIESEIEFPVPSRQELIIPGFRPPALNRLMRGKIKDRIRLGREARERIAVAARAWGVRRAVGVKRRVSLEITLTGRQKPLDVDAVWKAILDGLVHAGLLVDDSCRWAALGEVVFLRGEVTSTKIILDDLAEPPS